MGKRIGMLLLISLLLLTGMQGAFAAPKFTDVSENHRAAKEIDYLTEQGVIYGYPNGQFGVDDSIKRMHAALMITRALNLPAASDSKQQFTDLPADHPHYAIAAALADAGIMLGSTDGSFQPNQPVTRAQMAAILVRAFDLKGETSYNFLDVPKTSWASISIRTLLENGITTGYPDNTFRPNQPITRSQFATFMARVMDGSFKDAMACYKPDNNKQTVIDVQATTLWAQPGQNRPVDSPSVSDPTDLEKWTANMTRNEKYSLLGKIDTQALYGEKVTVLERQNGWVKIAVTEQATPKNAGGYPGWVPASHVTTTYPNYQECVIAVVKSQTATLYDTPGGKAHLEISFNTTLPVVKEEDGWIRVVTPANQFKYLKKADVNVHEDFLSIPKPTAQQLITTGKQFLGLPYLWAGVSGYGFDCSGFTYAVYKHHGILIPRDASVQAVNGTAVAKTNMQPGDLLFFAHDKGTGSVHHVAMYIGNGQMIHSPNYSRPLEIVSVAMEPYKSELSDVRRYLK